MHSGRRKFKPATATTAAQNVPPMFRHSNELDKFGMMNYSSDSDEGVDHAMVPLPNNSIVFNDMVHPHLRLPNICHRIMNTPQFQRLRSLKQLGLCYHVYPSASHNRFEHCVGTSYLAGKYCRALQRSQPELGITETDILCLNIAGLCHDLGHGPFSHTWESFMHDTVPEYSHEIMSLRLLDYMIEENGLWECLENNNLSEIDLIFIKEIILGHPLPDRKSEGLRGRGGEKYFLYQIVSNEDSKIDVDKFDYLLRDSKQLNLTTAFDYERVIENTRVVRLQDGRMGIAYRKKITTCLEDLFKGRFRMHQMAYQHRVTKIIEEMVLDGLRAADPYFRVTGKDGAEYKLSTAYLDLSAFIKLTDIIFELILNQWTPSGPTASLIFNNIVTRNLYKSLGFVTVRPTKEAISQLASSCPSVLVISSKINYGKGSENPLKMAWFYEKSKPNTLFRQSFDPPTMEEKYYIVLRPELFSPSTCSSSSSLAPPLPPDDLDTSSTSSQSEDIRVYKKLVREWGAQQGMDVQME